jgi:hypothetical protein
MRRLLLLLTLLFAVFLINTTLAQGLCVITLDQDTVLFGVPPKIVLLPGDTLQFKSINGDFSIYIKEAYKFLKTREDNLKIRVDSAGNAVSDLYEVRAVDKDMEVTFSIYCISKDSWPDAPPKIIIVSY